MNQNYVYEVKEGNVSITKYTGKETEIVIPSKIDGCPVTQIESKAFASNPYLQKVFVPTEICIISKEAFADCKNLKEMVLPGTELLTIHEQAFIGCEKLKTTFYVDIYHEKNKKFINQRMV